MDLKRCPNKHYYDGDKYQTCPHCEKMDGEAESTITVNRSETSDIPDNKTIGVFGELEPVVGWLVCITGSHKGEAFSLRAGINNIGRSPEYEVALLKDPMVSRQKMAFVIYDAKNVVFKLCRGDAREIAYFNGEALLETKDLKPYDRLSVGASELLFVPFCSKEFSWETI